MVGVRVPSELCVRDPEVLAPAAGLRVVFDEDPGVARKRWGRGFRYLGPDGKPVAKPERERLERLAVPPAWENVWMCPTSDGYLQATGRDDAERKQYRYHDAYRAFRDRQKFDRMRYFPKALRRIRIAVEEGLAGEVGTKDYAVAGALRLIDVGLVRTGNEESAQSDRRGATTLSADHVDLSDDEPYIRIEYTAKSGKTRSIVVEDDLLATVLAELADADQERLFWFEQDGESVRVTASHVNAAIAEIAGPAFSAKDFRTWGGSREALIYRASGGGVIEAVDAAAEVLGNTRAVARSSYVHPLVLQAEDSEIEESWRRSRNSARGSRGDNALARLLRSQT